jgi:hypothetical protein
MPATLDELARAVQLPTELVERLAGLAQASVSTHTFREVVDLALEALGGVVPPWPLLDDWNRWALASGMSFFVWQPHARALDERHRLEVLVHTAMMLAAKHRHVADYRRASLKEAEVVMAGDDCPICDEHRHHVAGLIPPAMETLPPFHPGCRCGILPHLE